MNCERRLTPEQVDELNWSFGQGDRQMESGTSEGRKPYIKIKVPDGTRCPLCPDHQDEEDNFAWSELMQSPICWGCTYDIYYGFQGFDDSPTPDEYNNAATIALILLLTGLNFQQAKFKYMKEMGGWPRTISNRLKKLTVEKLTDRELRRWNYIFDDEIIRQWLLKEVSYFRTTWYDKFESVRIKLSGLKEEKDI